MKITFEIGLYNAWIFMSIFIFQMIIMLLFDKTMRERTHVPSDVNRNLLEKYAGIIGNVIWLIAMIYSIFLPFQLGTIWFYVGFFIFMIGLIFLSIATHNFMTTSADQIVKKGVYLISRHPMYVATFFICLGSGIATKSWLFISLTILMSFCFFQEALLEEKYCQSKYGNVYKEYKGKTPRLLGVPKRNT